MELVDRGAIRSGLHPPDGDSEIVAIHTAEALQICPHCYN